MPDLFTFGVLTAFASHRGSSAADERGTGESSPAPWRGWRSGRRRHQEGQDCQKKRASRTGAIR